jgi:ATP-dependent RNA helicase DHX57
MLLGYLCVAGAPGAVLVFLPGLMEISKAHQAASSNPVINNATGGGRYLIGLHSSLASTDQNLVFDRPPPGVRKIVFATNIAETSVTIEDVVHVVDTGRVKETGFDVASRMAQLLEGWVSKASARQRRGRAGRTQAGQLWRLFTRATFATFPEASPPEIQRVPLEGLCLQVQLQRMSGGVAGFLSRALQAPEPEAVRGAVRNLVRIGALNDKENLTPLGHILVRIFFLSHASRTVGNRLTCATRPLPISQPHPY